MEPNAWIQFSGALLILLAYALCQLGRLPVRTLTFSLLNAAGGGLLAWEAARTSQWGFFLLEGTWALISIGAMLRLASRSNAQE